MDACRRSPDCLRPAGPNLDHAHETIAPSSQSRCNHEPRLSRAERDTRAAHHARVVPRPPDHLPTHELSGGQNTRSALPRDDPETEAGDLPTRPSSLTFRQRSRDLLSNSRRNSASAMILHIHRPSVRARDHQPRMPVWDASWSWAGRTANLYEEPDILYKAPMPPFQPRPKLERTVKRIIDRRPQARSTPCPLRSESIPSTTRSRHTSQLVRSRPSTPLPKNRPFGSDGLHTAEQAAGGLPTEIYMPVPRND